MTIRQLIDKLLDIVYQGAETCPSGPLDAWDVDLLVDGKCVEFDLDVEGHPALVIHIKEKS